MRGRLASFPRMAVTFEQDLDALIHLLAAGGYAARGARVVPESRGRNADVYLENGVVVCWDALTRKVWMERFTARGQRVENFLWKMCEGPRLLRPLAIANARMHARIQALHTSVARWLLLSENAIARQLRQQLSRP